MALNLAFPRSRKSASPPTAMEASITTTPTASERSLTHLGATDEYLKSPDERTRTRAPHVLRATSTPDEPVTLLPPFAGFRNGGKSPGKVTCGQVEGLSQVPGSGIRGVGGSYPRDDGPGPECAGGAPPRSAPRPRPLADSGGPGDLRVQLPGGARCVLSPRRPGHRGGRRTRLPAGTVRPAALSRFGDRHGVVHRPSLPAHREPRPPRDGRVRRGGVPARAPVQGATLVQPRHHRNRARYGVPRSRTGLVGRHRPLRGDRDHCARPHAPSSNAAPVAAAGRVPADLRPPGRGPARGGGDQPGPARPAVAGLRPGDPVLRAVHDGRTANGARGRPRAGSLRGHGRGQRGVPSPVPAKPGDPRRAPRREHALSPPATPRCERVGPASIPL